MKSNNSATYQAQPEKKKRGFGIFVLILLVVLLAATAYFGFLIYRDGFQLIPKITPEIVVEYSAGAESIPDVQEHPFQNDVPAPTPIPNPKPTLTPLPEDREIPVLDGQPPYLMPGVGINTIPDVFDAVSPSVVSIRNYAMMPYGGKAVMELYGSGTGFVVSSEGYILTNAHVVADAQLVTVQQPGGEELDATIIGMDVDTDVAVLKVADTNLKALALGDSDAVRVGDFVLAIGNPLDADLLNNTLTYGIISAKGREINLDGNTNAYIQTDAAVNYGNSGGPLLNLKGEVIGMTSAKTITAGYDSYGNAVSAEGIGYALPINTVVEIMEKLIEFGTIERPAVGITVYTLTEAMAAQLGVPQAVYVESVVKGGPASAAGVRAGDVIIAANGEQINDKEALIAIIQSCSIGDKIELLIHRNGETVICVIELSNKAAMDFNSIEEEGQEN